MSASPPGSETHQGSSTDSRVSTSSSNAGGPAAAVSIKSRPESSAAGEVLDQVLPDVPEKALNSIHDTIRVSVRVHANAAGNVSEAEFDSPAPNKYLADLALKAARRWEFAPPQVNGRSVASEWLIRFEFSHSGTKAVPKQITP